MFSALKKKERQLSRFGSYSPGILFVCDNDSQLLAHSQMYSPGTFRRENIVNVFLNGRPHMTAGPWLVEKGLPKQAHRIHAVVTLTVEDARSAWYPRPQRQIRGGSLLRAAHGNGFVCSEDFVSLMNEALDTLPLPASTPINAKREYQFPFGFGGWSMSDTKVTISLLTLQKLLAGKISYECFAREHAELVAHLKRLDGAGRMIQASKLQRSRTATTIQ